MRTMTKAYLDIDDIKALEQATTNLRDRLLVRLLFYSGCRISEALALEVSDVDINAGTIRIQHLKSRLLLSCNVCGTRLGKSHTFCPKCGTAVEDAVAKALECRRMRLLPLDKETLEMLDEFITRGGPIKYGDKVLIFGIGRHRAWQIIKGYAVKAGLPRLVNPESGKVHNITPHKLRDAFAVNAMKHDDSGDGLRLLQEHLGHANFNTTAKYRKVSGDEQNDWYQKLWRSPEAKNDKGKSS
jgi:integrase/recombinase XerD